jgi:DNA-binding NtrC family response regulator
MQLARLLIVDPDQALDDFYQNALAPGQTRTPVFARTADEGFTRLQAEEFDGVIAAVDPPTCNGLDLLRRARSEQISIPAILVTRDANLADATEALHLGASDYLTKPLSVEGLHASVARLLQHRRVDEENELLRRHVERPYSFDDIIRTCPAMRKVFETIERVADSDVDVLVIGETGTGKEAIARSLHRRSRRATRPFVPVDCGAIPENLLESEFFGHERGAFTGADNRTIGLLEFADGGTFFLDELGELPLLLQAKLLRTLQERKIRRVGGRAEIDVDVRVVAATGRNLEDMIRRASFRQDLYYRINVVRIDLPPLRERGDDLGLLAEYFATRYSREMGRPLVGLTPEAYQVMAAYSWPGNVRELQNIIRRAIALSSDDMIGLDDLPDSLIVQAGENRSGARSFFEQRAWYVSRFERQYLTDLLARHQGDVKTAADEAQIPRGTLYRLMKNHGLESTSFR